MEIVYKLLQSAFEQQRIPGCIWGDMSNSKTLHHVSAAGRAAAKNYKCRLSPSVFDVDGSTCMGWPGDAREFHSYSVWCCV